jgi:ubiquinone/menaquinone biosynthesis C-methylase UbiE
VARLVGPKAAPYTAPSMTPLTSDFDRRAATYDDNLWQRLFFEPVHSGLLAALPVDPVPHRVLDVGCGTGRLLERLARRWPEAEMVGVDPAPGMVEVARAKHQRDARFRFEITAAEELPFPDATFDLALSTASFHHWSEPLRGLGEVARVIRPGARLFLADAYPGGVLRLLAPVIRRLRGERYRRAGELRGLLAQAGFVVLEQRALPDVAGSVLLTISRSTSRRSWLLRG